MHPRAQRVTYVTLAPPRHLFHLTTVTIHNVIPSPAPPPLQTPLSRLCESADLIFVRYVRHSFSASVSHVTCYAPTPVLSLGCPTSCESRDKNACAVPFHEGRRGKLSLASIHRKHSIIFQVIHRLTQCLIRVQSAPTPQPTPSKA